MTDMEFDSPNDAAQQLAKILKFLEQDSIQFKDIKKSEKGTNNDDKNTVPLIPQSKIPILDFETWRKNRSDLSKEFATYGIQSGFAPGRRSIIGGNPIILETAMEIRNIVNGSAIHSLSSEWKKSAITFCYLDSPFPYGLQTQRRCGSKSLLLCIQAFILKHLLFTTGDEINLLAISPLTPSESERNKALVRALAEILWTAGENQRCCICLHLEDVCFDTDYRYRPDGITERIYVFEFDHFESVKLFLKRHIDEFMRLNSCGCLLFLYSLVLSRTVRRIKEDMGTWNQGKLLTDMEDCSQCLINLILTGRSVQYPHNGDILYDKYGEPLSSPLNGVKERSKVGFLYWNKREDDGQRTQVGSMLKTPKYPIWLTSINDQIGLLFSTNIDLISDWRTEHRFTLQYYTGLPSHTKTTILSIDTLPFKRRPRTARLTAREEERKVPALEQCINTKWYDANIHWNGTLPYI
ncbi:hypothetical protein SNE40_001557 [Patella caerulea]|uniref:Ubiquitin carboxyl-terminal hydrolase MINDY n=2 Tax=Patella caerulea TaxID=87958 RepID=A0AAN8KNF1_PATCE